MAPGTEYRFEDSPGLRHSCGICGTPLHHPRAIKTCYGKHAEPCPRFHHTMFRLGRTSSCDACKTSNNQHYKRHSAIAALAKEVHQKSQMKTPVPTLKEIANAIHGYYEDSLEGDRKALDEALSKDLNLYEKVNQKQTQKQARNKRNKNSDGAVLNEEILQILGRLGFDTKSLPKSKKEKEPLLRLVDAITNDIEVVANESRETMKRQLGFYQYADKRAYNALLRKKDNPGANSQEGGEEDGSDDLADAITTEDDAQEEEEDKEEGDVTTDGKAPNPNSKEKEKQRPKSIDTSMNQDNGMAIVILANTLKAPNFQRTLVVDRNDA